MVWGWVAKLFNSGDAVKKTLEGVGDLAKDIRTVVTGKIDTETMLQLEIQFAKLDNALAQFQASVVSTEAKGNWLQRSWRPITMLTFLILTILNQFDLLTIKLSDEIWGLFKVGLGGYIGGRSLEKVVGTLKK